MSKNIIGLTLCVILFALCFSAHAQEPKKIARIGYLSGTDRATDSPRAEGIRRALRELGYVEGKNIHIEYRHAEGKSGRQPELAAELVRLKVALILVAGGDGGIKAAMSATKTIPIVLTGLGSDPVRAGLIQSLAQPGGNVTGVTGFSRELGGKRLELLKETAPNLIRVAVLYQPTVPGTAREVKEDLPVAARALKLSIQPQEIQASEDFDRIFTALNKNHPEGLYVPGGGSLVRSSYKRIAEFALKIRLASLYSDKEGTLAGGLMNYGADFEEVYRRVAYYVDRILKGAQPGDLPVEQPTKFEFVINSKTAKQIGLTIPPDLLVRATKIIK